MIMLSTGRKEKRCHPSRSLSLLDFDMHRERYNSHSITNKEVNINLNQQSLTKLSKSMGKGLSSKPFFESERATNIRSIGSMLSGLSKSNLNQGKIPRKETGMTLNKSRPNNREMKLHQKKISRIESMKQIYMQDRSKDSEVKHEFMKNTTKSHDTCIKQYNMQRQIGRVAHCSINQEIHFLEDTQGEDKIKDETSIRELIEWLETVELNGIRDFV